MQNGDGAVLDDAVSEIAELLAKAYQRYAKLRLVRPAPEALQATKSLDNAAEPSLHELTLTTQRKESARS